MNAEKIKSLITSGFEGMLEHYKKNKDYLVYLPHLDKIFILRLVRVYCLYSFWLEDEKGIFYDWMGAEGEQELDRFIYNNDLVILDKW